MAKGIGLLWVVAVHTSLVKTPRVHELDWCSAFALPMFFLISGLFHRDLPTRDFVRKKFCQLLVPFICFEFLGFAELLLRIAVGNGTPSELKGLIIHYPYEPFCGPTWFLLALFWLACLYNILHKHIYTNRFLFYFLILGLSVSGFYINRFKLFGHHCYLPFFVGQTLAMLPLFALGHFFTERTGGLGNWSRKVWIAIFLGSLIYMVTLTLLHRFGGVLLASARYQFDYITTMSNAIAGSMFILAVCRLLQSRYWYPLSYIGEASLFIMATHLLVLRLLYRFVGNGYFQFLIALGISVALYIPIKRYCPFLCGKMKPEQLDALISKVFKRKERTIID